MLVLGAVISAALLTAALGPHRQRPQDLRPVDETGVPLALHHTRAGAGKR